MRTIPYVFEALGLSALEERLYVALIDTPSGTVRELSNLLHVSTGQIQRTLGLLREKGLVTETATRPRRYIPSPPEVSVEVLILKRQEELHHARLAAAHLAERHRIASEKTHTGDLLEILSGSQIHGQRFRQMRQAASEEILFIDRPPYANPLGPGQISVASELLARGVRCRSIYSRESLEIPGRLSTIDKMVEMGWEARILPDTKTKLVIVDRRVGMIPLNLQEHGIEDAVVVHASFLLHALILLFESLWEKATPLGAPAEHQPDVEPKRDELLRLLASGLKDESIARILGWSRTTVTRRMRELMQELGAKTRFQLALLADRKFRFYDRDEDRRT